MAMSARKISCAGLICEILGPEGDALVGDGLMAYAQENALKVISIADLIAYRQQREKLVTREATFELITGCVDSSASANTY